MILRANFWTILSEEKIPVKSLLAVLYQFQERGLAMAREERERELCLQSAGLYLVMLSLLTRSRSVRLMSRGEYNVWDFFMFQIFISKCSKFLLLVYLITLKVSRSVPNFPNALF